jgi:hypothetical protein
MKKIVLDENGRKRVGAVAKLGSTTWFSFGGEVWTHETEVRGRRGKSLRQAPLIHRRSLAPMPGKIVKGSCSSVGSSLSQLEVMWSLLWKP